MRLVVRNLACDRSGRPVFSNLTFDVEQARALIVTGPNGAGKSSLLRLLAGLLAPAAGSIALEGGDTQRPRREDCHYLGHKDGVKPALTPRENLSFWQAMLGRGAMTPDAALDEWGLAHAADLPAAYLSAGQRRRLALARLTVSRRPLWLLDEPTAALDQASQTRFAAIARAHLAEGGLIVAATHVALGFDGAEALALGDTP